MAKFFACVIADTEGSSSWQISLFVACLALGLPSKFLGAFFISFIGVSLFLPKSFVFFYTTSELVTVNFLLLLVFEQVSVLVVYILI